MQKNNILKLILSIIVIIAIVFGVKTFLKTDNSTINLNKYISINVEGYNNYGKARYEIDSKKLCKDFGKYVDEVNDSSFFDKFEDKEQREAITIDGLIFNCIHGDFDKGINLSNGDTTVFKWNCDESYALERFGVELKYSDIEFKVKGLKKIEQVNPFDDIDVIFYGVESMGCAKVEIKENNNIKKEFTVSQNGNLSNGDVVEVSLRNGDDDNYCAKHYGYIPSEISRKYVVEGLTQEEVIENIDTSMLAVGEEIVEQIIAEETDSSSNDITEVTNVPIELTKSQEKMMDIIDALVDSCYYDEYSPNNSAFFWNVMYNLVSSDVEYWQDEVGYLEGMEFGSVVYADKLDKAASAMFVQYNGLLELENQGPYASVSEIEEGKYRFAPSDGGIDYNIILKWEKQADGTYQVIVQNAESYDDITEYYDKFEFILVDNPRLDNDPKQIYDYSVVSVKKISE